MGLGGLEAGQAPFPHLVVSGLSMWSAALGFLTIWQLMSSRARVPINRGGKLSYLLCSSLRTFSIGQQSHNLQGREHRPHISMGRVSESLCRRAHGVGDTVEAIFGKSKLPCGLTVNSQELSCRKPIFIPGTGTDVQSLLNTTLRGISNRLNSINNFRYGKMANILTPSPPFPPSP